MRMSTHNNPKMLIKTIPFGDVDMFNITRYSKAMFEKIFFQMKVALKEIAGHSQ